MAKTKLEELVVELTVENRNLVNQLKASTEETNKTMKSMAKSIESFATDASKNVSSFQRIFETAIGFIGGQMVVGAFQSATSAAVGLFKTMIVDGVQAAQAEEDALNRLNTALGLAGHYSKQASNELRDYADELSRTTKFQGETIIQASALIESLGRLDKDGLKQATAAALDLSAALGIDLNAAAQLVGKAANGDVASFNRYGIAIEKGATAAETFTKTLDALNQRFGGSAEAQVRTFSGAVLQLQNSFGDVTKEIGFVITQNEAAINLINELNKVIREQTGEIKESNQALKVLAGEGLASTITGLAAVVVFLDTAVRSFETLSAAVELAQNPMIGFETTVRERLGDTSEHAEELRRKWEDIKKGLQSFGEEGDGQLAKIAVRMLELKEATLKGVEDMRAGLDATTAATNAQTDATRKSAEEQKKLNEEALKGRDIALQLITGMEEDNAVRLALLEEQFNAEVALLQTARDRQKITEEQYHTAVRALEMKSAAERKKRALEMERFELSMAKSRVDIFSGAAALISAVSSRESKAAFLISKAAGVAQSIVSTNVAAAMALASPPGPPATIPLAANVKMAGMLNTAAILATTVQGLQRGIDEVPGIGFKDSFPAMLAPRERVVPAETNKDLKKFLNLALNGRGQFGQQNVTVEIVLRDELVDFVEARLIERQRIRTSREVA